MKEQLKKAIVEKATFIIENVDSDFADLANAIRFLTEAFNLLVGIDNFEKATEKTNS